MVAVFKGTFPRVTSDDRVSGPRRPAARTYKSVTGISSQPLSGRPRRFRGKNREWHVRVAWRPIAAAQRNVSSPSVRRRRHAQHLRGIVRLSLASASAEAARGRTAGTGRTAPDCRSAATGLPSDRRRRPPETCARSLPKRRLTIAIRSYLRDCFALLHPARGGHDRRSNLRIRWPPGVPAEIHVLRNALNRPTQSDRLHSIATVTHQSGASGWRRRSVRARSTTPPRRPRSPRRAYRALYRAAWRSLRHRKATRSCPPRAPIP